MFFFYGFLIPPALSRCSTASTLSVRPSWKRRWQKAVRAWTPPTQATPPSSRDLSALRAHTACCPPRPRPPLRPPRSPTTKHPPWLLSPHHEQGCRRRTPFCTAFVVVIIRTALLQALLTAVAATTTSSSSLPPPSVSSVTSATLRELVCV